MDKTIKIGNSVLYHGSDNGICFTEKTTVLSIERVEPGEKYGISVSEISIKDKESYGVFILSNGRWGYGEQVELCL